MVSVGVMLFCRHSRPQNYHEVPPRSEQRQFARGAGGFSAPLDCSEPSLQSLAHTVSGIMSGIFDRTTPEVGGSAQSIPGMVWFTYFTLLFTGRILLQLPCATECPSLVLATVEDLLALMSLGMGLLYLRARNGPALAFLAESVEVAQRTQMESRGTLSSPSASMAWSLFRIAI